MLKFVIKNPFYWRGRLVQAGSTITVPETIVNDLVRKDVLGVAIEEKSPAGESQEAKSKSPENATKPEPPETASVPTKKKE